MFRPRLSKGVIHIGDFGLPKNQETWLEKTLGDAPTIDDVDRMLAEPTLTKDQRQVLEAVRDSARGLRMKGGVAITKSGTSNIRDAPKAWNLRGAVATATPTGKASSKGAELEERMLPYLVGQEQTLPAFLQMSEAFHSSVRRLPPIMIVSGPQGHGKEQAIEGYARAALGENAQVVPVDLTRFSDSNFEELFDDGSPVGDLSPWRLTEIEDHKSAVIHITGLADLRTRSPLLAERLLNLLSAKRNDLGHVWVSFFVDFDVDLEDDDAETNPLKQFATALGNVGRYLPCAHAKFDRLGEAAMQQYAYGMIEELLEEPGLGQLRIEIDDDAREVLAKILATPHQPMVELEPRIQELIFAQIGKYADTIPADAVLRVGLESAFASDPVALEARIKALHEKDADILSVSDVFRVRPEGRVADDEARATILEKGAELSTTILQLVNKLSSGEERYAPEYGWLARLLSDGTKLANELDMHADVLRHNAGHTVAVEDARSLLTSTVDVEELLRGLATAGQARLASLGLSLPVPNAKASRDMLDGIRYLAKGLVVDASSEQAARLGKNAHALASTLKSALAGIAAANEEISAGALLTRFQSLAHSVQSLVDEAEARATDDVWPLVSEREAGLILAEAEELRALLGQVGDTPGPAATLVSAMNAAGASEIFGDVINRATRVANALGGLAKEDRPTILDLRTKELSDSPALRRKLAKEIVRCENGATEEDARIVQAELVKVPLRVMKRLKKFGIPVTVIRGKMTDYMKMPEDQKSERPPGYPEGKTYDDIPAIFTNYQRDGTDTSEVIIVTKEQGGRRIIPGLSMKEGNNSVIHEVMHAFDRNSVFSGTDEFGAARDTDLADLSPYEKQAVEGDGFDRGASETFAITGERLYGGDAQVKAKRPNLVDYVESATRDLDAEPEDTR